MASSTEGSSTSTGWNRRSSAASFSMCLRYSVERGGADHVQLAPGQHRLEHVAGVHRALRRRRRRPRCAARRRTAGSGPRPPSTSSSTALSRSSNSPRYFAPATSEPMSRAKTILSRRPSGTSPRMIRWARPSTIAVLPTPGSPMSTGLFLVLRDRIWTTRRISRVPADHRVELARPGHRPPGPARTSRAPRRPPRAWPRSPAGCPARRERLEEAVAGEALLVQPAPRRGAGALRRAGRSAGARPRRTRP